MENANTTALAKEQSERLSELLEKLLIEEHSRRAPNSTLGAAALLIAVASEKRLVNIWATPEEDAAWVHL